MKDIVGEHPSHRKRHSLRKRRNSDDATYWLGMHQNNNCHTRQEPSLPHITMRVVDWDVRPVRRTQ